MTKTKHKAIRSFEELVAVCYDDEPRDFFIVLAGGAVRSSKSIQLRENGKSFYVLNENDGSRQVLNAKSLYTRSNIGEAMEKGAFFMYGYD